MRPRMRARLRALRSARSSRAKAQRESRSRVDRTTVLTALAEACAHATLGLEVCAKRSRNPIVMERANELALAGRSLCDSIALERSGVRPRIRMADRMRWEWLASTGSLLDASPESRVVSECLRVFDAAIDAACAFHGDLPLVPELVAQIRAIDALNVSLALTLEPATR